MIATLRGTIQSIGVSHVVIEVSGVGYLVHVTPVFAASVSVGSEILLYTSQVVREDAHLLYGFHDAAARDFFELLQTVSGIGPRVAQSMLTSFSPGEIESAIIGESSQTLEKIPGIGKKVAGRLILELRDKFSSHSQRVEWSAQLSAALIGLGYTAKDAEQSIAKIRKKFGASANDRSLSELLKISLSNVGE